MASQALMLCAAGFTMARVDSRSTVAVNP